MVNDRVTGRLNDEPTEETTIVLRRVCIVWQRTCLPKQLCSCQVAYAIFEVTSYLSHNLRLFFYLPGDKKRDASPHPPIHNFTVVKTGCHVVDSCLIMNTEGPAQSIRPQPLDHKVGFNNIYLKKSSEMK